MKLNLGCNNQIMDGYVNVDIYPYNDDVVVGDCTKLDFVEKESCDEIYAQDILEHFPYTTGVDVLKLWCSLLKKGGRIFIQTPDLEKHIHNFQSGVWGVDKLNYFLFAGVPWGKSEVDDFDFHKAVYTSSHIEKLLNDFGVHVDECTKNEMNMFIWGTKI